MSPRLCIFRLLLCNLWLVLSVHGLRTSHDALRRKHSTSTVVGSILNLTRKANCSQPEFEAARQTIAEPPASQVVSQPYATSLPVVYITAGGNRENRFKRLYANFTPRLYRVQAVDGQNRSQVARLISHANRTLDLFKENKVSARAIGCMLSHMVALQEAYILGLEAALILEDDAVPLVPWWPVSLEEFVLRLPQGWHASQMQWSSNINKSSFSVALENKRGRNRSRLFTEGSGWGTAAYLISRRGMKKVANDLYDSQSKKFDAFRLVTHCSKFSADDCLFGFTDTASKKTMREVRKTAIIRNIYKANPPYFLHGSTRRKVHRFNLCLDTVAIATSTKKFLPLTQTNDPQRKKLLLFVPASMKAAKSQILTNMKHARQSAGVGCCDLFPAFRAKERPNSKGLRIPPLDKFELLKQHYPNFGEVWKRTYDYIWVLDTNMDLTVEDIQKVISAVESAGPVVAQPVVSQLVSENRSDVVQVAAPLIRMNSLSTVLMMYAKSKGNLALNCTSTPNPMPASPLPASPLPVTILQREELDDDALLEGDTEPDSPQARKLELSCINLQAHINLH